MESNVSVVMCKRPQIMQFSDLSDGDYFVASGNDRDEERLFRVRKSNNDNYSAASPVANGEYGYAECVDDDGRSYTTASNACFPRGVRRVDVEIKVIER